MKAMMEVQRCLPSMTHLRGRASAPLASSRPWRSLLDTCERFAGPRQRVRLHEKRRRIVIGLKRVDCDMVN
jgi:hypothetical protein